MLIFTSSLRGLDNVPGTNANVKQQEKSEGVTWLGKNIRGCVFGSLYRCTGCRLYRHYISIRIAPISCKTSEICGTRHRHLWTRKMGQINVPYLCISHCFATTENLWCVKLGMTTKLEVFLEPERKKAESRVAAWRGRYDHKASCYFKYQNLIGVHR